MTVNCSLRGNELSPPAYSADRPPSYHVNKKNKLISTVKWNPERQQQSKQEDYSSAKGSIKYLVKDKLVVIYWSEPRGVNLREHSIQHTWILGSSLSEPRGVNLQEHPKHTTDIMTIAVGSWQS